MKIHSMGKENIHLQSWKNETLIRVRMRRKRSKSPESITAVSERANNASRKITESTDFQETPVPESTFVCSGIAITDTSKVELKERKLTPYNDNRMS